MEGRNGVRRHVPVVRQTQSLLGVWWFGKPRAFSASSTSAPPGSETCLATRLLSALLSRQRIQPGADTEFHICRDIQEPDGEHRPLVRIATRSLL
jgi:hypothetical protein